MSKIKSALLHGLLFSCLAVMPVSAFGMTNNNGGDMNGDHDKTMTPKTEQPKVDETLPHVEKTSARFHVGVYYGRPFYYRPYYYYYPYRPYYYRHYYRPYHRW